MSSGYPPSNIDYMPAWVPETIRNDPRKAGVLGVLLLVLAVLIGRYLLQGGPTPAQGAAKATPPTKKTTDNHKPRLEVLASSSEARQWLKQPINSVGRNLFTIRPELFPTLKTAEAQKITPGFWDAIEKSRSDQADQKKRRDVLIENLQREAAKLQLQSTVMGPEPQAIIGGKLVKEGSVVASDGPEGVQFRVLVIEPRRVVVERQGIRLELRMLH